MENTHKLSNTVGLNVYLAHTFLSVKEYAFAAINRKVKM